MPDEVMPYRFSGRTQLAEVSPGVFALDLPTPLAIGSTNSYIFKADGIHDNGRSLIVDAGCNSSLTKETFDKALIELHIAWENVDVFITHFHWDHCAGLDQIWQPGMKVYAGVQSTKDHGTPVMAARELGEIERRTSEYFEVGDEYDPAYWQPMTINGEKDIVEKVGPCEVSIKEDKYDYYVQAYVDLKDLGVGTHKVKVNYKSSSSKVEIIPHEEESWVIIKIDAID